MAGRGRGEGGRQDSPVSAQGWCGDRCGADGAVGTSGSGRRACRAPREAWGTRVQGTARQLRGRKRAPGPWQQGCRRRGSQTQSRPGRRSWGSAGQPSPGPWEAPWGGSSRGRGCRRDSPGTAQQQEPLGGAPESPGASHTQTPRAFSAALSVCILQARPSGTPEVGPPSAPSSPARSVEAAGSQLPPE